MLMLDEIHKTQSQYKNTFPSTLFNFISVQHAGVDVSPKYNVP